MKAKVRKAWYAIMQYRPNPADSVVGVMDLGFFVEFTTDENWVVGAAIRAFLDEEKIRNLDELTRTLLQHRQDVVARELGQVLVKSKRPGQVLQLLSSENPWSFFISSPVEVEIPASAVASSRATLEKLLETYVSTI